MLTWSRQKILADHQCDKQLFLKFTTLPGTTTIHTNKHTHTDAEPARMHAFSPYPPKRPPGQAAPY